MNSPDLILGFEGEVMSQGHTLFFRSLMPEKGDKVEQPNPDKE